MSKSKPKPQAERTKPIPVRLTETLAARLTEAAKRCGTNRTALMRVLVTKWLDYYEAEPQDSLPLNFEEIMMANDGRRRELKMEGREKRSPNPRYDTVDDADEDEGSKKGKRKKG